MIFRVTWAIFRLKELHCMQHPMLDAKVTPVVVLHHYKRLALVHLGNSPFFILSLTACRFKPMCIAQ